MSEILKYPNKNPWYVLATIYGEQAEDASWVKNNGELAAKNRRAWNGWFCADLSAEERKDRADKTGLEVADLMPLGKNVIADITKRLRERLKDQKAELPDRTEDIDFKQLYFSKFVHFEKFVFETNCDFRSSTFSRDAYFPSSMFSGHADFKSSTFSDEADFSSAKFKSTTQFIDARFETHVPEFHGAELFEKTLFPTNANDDGNWPPRAVGENKSEGQIPVEEQAFAYNRLQQFMNKTMRIDEEQFFHRMEMRCKGKIDGGAYDLLHTLFDAVSEYGNSVWKPVSWLIGLWFVGWVAYLHKSPIIFGEAPVWKAAGWSFAKIFSFFGLQKRYFEVDGLSSAIQVVGGVQTVAGFVLLFFLGLGLRNRFRLR